MAGLGEPHHFAGPVKQLDPQLVLQSVDLVADGGLGDAQVLRRAGKIQIIGHGQKTF